MSSLNFPKLMMIEHLKMMKIPYLYIWSMLFRTSSLHRLSKSLVFDTKRPCASSNTTLDKNSLPLFM